jgi:hypothetical protein
MEVCDLYQALERISKPGLAPEGHSVFQQILQLQGCLSRF